jgi:hypothetical protein
VNIALGPDFRAIEAERPGAAPQGEGATILDGPLNAPRRIESLRGPLAAFGDRALVAAGHPSPPWTRWPPGAAGFGAGSALYKPDDSPADVAAKARALRGARGFA